MHAALRLKLLLFASANKRTPLQPPRPRNAIKVNVTPLIRLFVMISPLQVPNRYLLFPRGRGWTVWVEPEVQMFQLSADKKISFSLSDVNALLLRCYVAYNLLLLTLRCYGHCVVVLCVVVHLPLIYFPSKLGKHEFINRFSAAPCLFGKRRPAHSETDHSVGKV